MEILNIETISISHSNFKTFQTNANEYVEDFPKFIMSIEKKEGSMDYMLLVLFKPVQRKNGQAGMITISTVFSFRTSEEITYPLNEDVILFVTDLLYVAWSYTTARFNVMSAGTIFKDHYLSKRSLADFYNHLKKFPYEPEQELD